MVSISGNLREKVVTDEVATLLIDKKLIYPCAGCSDHHPTWMKIGKELECWEEIDRVIDAIENPVEGYTLEELLTDTAEARAEQNSQLLTTLGFECEEKKSNPKFMCQIRTFQRYAVASGCWVTYVSCSRCGRNEEVNNG